MIVDSLDLSPAQFAAGTGWDIKPEGACKAEVCVPLSAGEPFSATATSTRLGMAIVRDERAGIWAIGPESFNQRALTSALAPELVLNDLKRPRVPTLLTSRSQGRARRLVALLRLRLRPARVAGTAQRTSRQGCRDHYDLVGDVRT